MTTQDMTTQRSRLGFALIAMAGLSVGLSAPTAHANPNEGDATIAAGTAIFDSNGNLLTITTSDMAIIDWLAFNIGFGETVQFIMPDSTSRVLNRIDGAAPSIIDGTLTSNGQVFLVNPSGVVFGENAVVNAGSLYAAAGNISNTNFINETYRFTDMQGTVVNRGHLQGDVIALLGGQVANFGTISAPQGTVIMAAGSQVLIGTELGRRFVEIEAPVLATEAPGSTDDSIRLAAGDIYSIAAWNSGTIDARGVIISAQGGDVGLAGSINATGAGNGGYLTVRGDNVVVTENNVVVTENIEARGTPITAGTISLTAGPGGVVDLGADLHSTGSGTFITGDVVLSESITLISSGTSSQTRINDDIYSETGEFNTLDIQASNGQVFFGGTVGDTPTSDNRLGFLDIDARKTIYNDNVSTRDGMTLMGLSEIQGPSVTFHTGTGSALFGGDIYSFIRGGSDVAFMYDGPVWTGQGEARTPFKFRGSIGSRQPLSTVPNQGPFRNITFGTDVNGSIVASAFLFSNAATEGLSLMDASAIDLSNRFFVSATEGIFAGRGQKITSFGSIQFAAKSNGATNIQLSDVNVLGDLRISSNGRTGNDITLLGHLGGFIDGVDNEADRSAGGYDEQGAELIASGDIFLSGSVQTDAGGAMLGAQSVVFANNAGSGTTLGAGIVEIFPGGASLANFSSTLPASNGLVYAYDLTLGDFTDFNPPTVPGSQANLAESFADEDILRLRDDAPYLAQRQVLIELGLAPRDVTGDEVREGVIVGSERYAVASDQTPAVIMDRLSPRSVERLTDSYISLFGVRDADAAARPGIQEISAQLASGDQDEIDVLMSKIGIVLDRIALLELSPLEIERAQDNLLEMLRPDSMSSTEFRSQWASN
ncbi:MAG: filamentous hemagglutinin N-terminal domain-containing protein [Phycisphaerales bacterium]